MISALTLFNDLGCLDAGDGQKCTRERALPIRQKNCLSTLSFLLMSISMKCIPVQMVDGISSEDFGQIVLDLLFSFWLLGLELQSMHIF